MLIRKWFTLFIVSVLSVVIISGCGKDNKEEVKEEPVQKEEVEEIDDKPEEIEEENEEPTETEVSSGDFSELIKYMEETTEGNATVLYENDEQQTHEAETITATLEGYTLVELDDFHTDYDIPFDRETEGGVLIAEYTVENTGDEDAYYMTVFDLDYPGTTKAHNNYDALLPEDVQMKNMLGPSNDYLIKAGESFTGYYAYPLSAEVLEKVLDLSTITININTPHSDKGDVNSNFGKKGKFVIPLSDEGSEKAEANKAFYEDKVTYDDMGDKKMLKEKSDINESEMLRDVKVTLDGYQFTEFTPNEEEAPRFSGFENGMVLLTVKFLIENDGDEEIEQNSSVSKLTVNDGSNYLLNEGMLLQFGNDYIEPGDSGEILQIFLMDQEQYEKIWKDKAFEIDVGPFTNAEAKDVSKGNKVNFTLPK